MRSLDATARGNQAITADQAPARADSPDRYARMLDRAPVGCAVVDSSGRIQEINRSGADLLGWTPQWLAGRKLDSWIGAEDAPRFAAHLRAIADGAASASAQLRIKTRNGRLRDIVLQSVPWNDGEAPASLTALIDVTDIRRSEREARIEQARLMQVARFNTMGEMASNLAHELNQPLAAIVLDADACLRMVHGGPDDVARLDATLRRLSDSAAYAAGIIAHLRNFLRCGQAERKPIDLNTLIAETMRVAERDMRDHEVAIRLELDASLPPIVGDAVQIEQVLLNLLRNSVDAMVGSATALRQITIRTGWTQDGQARLSVTDNGPGVPRHNAPRLFEPLFTTKRDGMGLGLSISRSLAETNAGRLWLDADATPGATFHCVLPTTAGPSP